MRKFACRQHQGEFRRALTLLETLAAVVLLTIIIATLVPLLKSAAIHDQPQLMDGAAVEMRFEFDQIVDALVADPASFDLDLEVFSANPTAQVLTVPSVAYQSVQSTESPITTIILRPTHSFTTPAGRFILVELAFGTLNQRRILRIGDPPESEENGGGSSHE